MIHRPALLAFLALAASKASADQHKIRKLGRNNNSPNRRTTQDWWGPAAPNPAPLAKEPEAWYPPTPAPPPPRPSRRELQLQLQI